MFAIMILIFVVTMIGVLTLPALASSRVSEKNIYWLIGGELGCEYFTLFAGYHALNLPQTPDMMYCITAAPLVGLAAGAIVAADRLAKGSTARRIIIAAACVGVLLTPIWWRDHWSDRAPVTAVEN